MKAFYSRISTAEQSDERQLQDLEGFEVFSDVGVSGSIPIWNRPEGAKLRKQIDLGNVTELHIHAVDRLGRNTIAVLQVWEELTTLGIRVVCRNPNLVNLDLNGKPDMVSTMILSILSVMASFERTLMLERQAEGIALAKEKGTYKYRDNRGAESVESFLAKGKPHKIAKSLRKGMSISEVSRDRKASRGSVRKVRDLMDQGLI